MAESVLLLCVQWLDTENDFTWQSPIKSISPVYMFYTLVSSCSYEPGKESSRYVECSW